jgi:hypothetical protein
MPASLGRVEVATIDVVAHMPRCRDCKWWCQSDLGPRSPTPPYGTCRFEIWPTTVVKAFTNGLVTHPDFGCVQWEARSE